MTIHCFKGLGEKNKSRHHPIKIITNTTLRLDVFDLLFDIFLQSVQYVSAIETGRSAGLTKEKRIADWAILLRGDIKVDVSTVKPEVYQTQNTPVKANGNDVNLETEVGAMVKNSLRYETLIRLLIKEVNGIDKIIDTP